MDGRSAVINDDIHVEMLELLELYCELLLARFGLLELKCVFVYLHASRVVLTWRHDGIAGQLRTLESAKA